MPPDIAGPNGAYPYEVRIPNDFEPVNPEVTDPGQRAALQTQRMARFVETQCTWDAEQVNGNYACSTGRVFGETYDLQVPAVGAPIIQKLVGNRWVTVEYPTPDRQQNLGLQMRIQTLRKNMVARQGGATPSPDRPATTDTAPAGGESVSRREPIVTIPGGMSRLVNVAGNWYDVVANFNGTTEMYINRGGDYQAINPTGPLQKTLQAEIAAIRSAPGFRPSTGGTTAPDRPTDAAPVAADTVGRREPIITIPGGMSRLVTVGATWYDVVANFNGTNEFYANRGTSYERVTPTGGIEKALKAEIATIRSAPGFRPTGGPAPTPDRPAPTPDRPAPTPEVGPVTGANARERAVNTVLRLSFGEGVGFSPDRAAVDRHIANNHIEDPANYARHMTAAAENLRAALGTRAGARGTVSVDGARLVFTSQAGDLRLVANAQFVLRDSNPTAARSYSYVIDQGPSSGTEVRYSPNGPQGLTDGQQRQVANYDVYEIAAPGGGTMLQMYGRDGSLRQALLGQSGGGSFNVNEVRSYSGQGDVRNPRPSVIRTLGPTTVRLPSRDGASTTSDYNLQRGTHYVPESGEPVRSYAEATDPSGRRQARRTEYRALLAAGRTREAADVKATLDADLNANLNSVQSWMRNLVTACRGNPRAMTEAVTGVMTFTARSTGEGIGTVSGRDRTDRGADLQSPELTVFLGGGHCKDFAFLLQHLCQMAERQFPGTGGARPLVAVTHDTHSSAYFIQEVPKPGGGTGYKLCKMHVLGYEEGPVVDTPDQAVRQIWERSHSTHATAYDHARALGDRNVPAGDGVVVFDAPASPTDNTGGFGYTRFEDAARYMVRPMR